MKKTAIIVGILLMCASASFADEVDQDLPNQTAEQLKANTREMIRLGISTDEAVKMTRAMVENRFQVENAVQAQEVVMNAKKQGLPAGPVMNKAHEGIAKNVQAGSIVAAMEKTRERYAYAYEKAKTLGIDTREVAPTGDVIAESMAAGLTRRDADVICDRLQTRDRLRTTDTDQTPAQDRQRDREQIHKVAQESFMTVREMNRLGVPSDVASDTVCQALENGYQARDMEQLRNTFMNRARQGDPAQLAKTYAHAIRNGAGAQDLDSPGRLGKGWSDEASGSGMSGGPGQGTGSGAGSGGPGSGGSDSGEGAGGPGSGGSDSGEGAGGPGSGGSDSGAGTGGSSDSGPGSSGSGAGGDHGDGGGSGSGGKK